MAEMTKQDLDDYISREVIRLVREQSAIEDEINETGDLAKGLDHEGNFDEEIEMEFEEKYELLYGQLQGVIRDIDCLHGLRQLLTLSSDSTTVSSG